MTVSLALRRDPSIPEKTQRRIRKLADLLGYAPDPMLTALSSYRKQQRPAAYQANIAWLADWSVGADRPWDDFALYHHGAASRAQELGYKLDDINLLGENKNVKNLRRLLDARNITGLLLAPRSGTVKEFAFDLSRYSAVRLGYSYRAPLLNTVANSQYRTVLVTMQKLVALGYRRIGTLLNEDVDERTSWHFLGGYLAGQHPLRPEDRLAPLYVGSNPPPEYIFDWIKKEKVDCLVGAGYAGLYQALVKMGLDIPGRFGFASTQLAEGERVISGIYQNSHEIGSAAVDLLVSMMQRHTIGLPIIPQHLLIEGSWREGKTVVVQRR